MARWLVILSAAALMLPMTAAQSFEGGGGGTKSVTYGSQLDVSCDPSTCSSGQFTAEACGGEKHFGSAGPGKVTGSVDIPKDLPCSVGEHTLKYTDSTGVVKTEVINVKPKNMASNKGSYLYLKANMRDGDTSDVLRNFFISNYEINQKNFNFINPCKPVEGSCIPVEKWDMMISENDPDLLGGPISVCVYDVPAGVIETPRDSSLKELGRDDFQSKFSGDCSANGGVKAESLRRKYFGPTDEKLDSPDEVSDGINFNGKSWTPLHADGNYDLEGGLIHGYRMKDGGSKSTKKFFVCRGSMDGVSVGTKVDPGENGGKIYRCDDTVLDGDWRDGKAGDWEEVDTCSDGVDNDGDGAVDSEDASCKGGNSEYAYVNYGTGAVWNRNQNDGSTNNQNDGSTNTGDSISDVCNKPRAVKSYEERTTNLLGWTKVDANKDGTKVEGVLYGSAASSNANYRWTSSGTTCYYKNFDGGSNTKENDFPKTFECNRPGNNGILSGGRKQFCNNLPSSYFDSKDNPRAHKAPLEAVEYYVPLENIPEGTGSSYVTTEGLDQTKMETLHDGEIEYASSSVHQKKSYNDRNIQDLGDGYKQGEYTDSWTTANAGETSGKVTSGNGPVTDTGVFKGGFVPRCQGPRTWTFDQQNGEWECSGAANNWDQVVYLPDVEDGDSDGKAAIGMIVFPRNFYPVPGNSLKYSISYPISKVDSSPEYGAASEVLNNNPMEKISVTCETGAGSFSKTVELKPDESRMEEAEPVVIQESVEIGNSDSYSCNWHYVTGKEGDKRKIGNVINIDENQKVFEFMKGKHNKLQGGPGSEVDYEDDELKTETQSWRTGNALTERN